MTIAEAHKLKRMATGMLRMANDRLELPADDEGDDEFEAPRAPSPNASFEDAMRDMENALDRAYFLLPLLEKH